MTENIRSGLYGWEMEDKLQPVNITTGQQNPRGALAVSIGSVSQEGKLRVESSDDWLCSTECRTEWQSPGTPPLPQLTSTSLTPTCFSPNVILKAILIFFLLRENTYLKKRQFLTSEFLLGKHHVVNIFIILLHI